ncbi:MAG: AI-2E family transporter [Planctomycetota bacterium]
MLERLSKNHRNIALAGIALLALWFAWTVRAVLNPLILGYLLAYILRPSVRRLERGGMRRRTAVNVIFALFGLALLGIGGGVFVQGRQFVENQARLIDEGRDPFTRTEQAIDSLLGTAGDWIDSTFRSDAADDLVDGKVGAPEGDGEEEPGEAAPTNDGPSDVPATDDLDPAPAVDDAAGPASAEGDAPEGPSEGSSDEAPAPAGALDLGSSDGSTQGDGDEPSEVDESELTLRTLVRAWAESWTDAEGETTGLQKARVVLGYVQRVFGGVLSVLSFLLLLPVYTYFLLFELERIHEFVRAHIPKKERDRVTRIAQSTGSVIANFFRGRLLICVVKGLVIAVGLAILGVPYGLLIGVLSGFLALVPFVGPTIGFVAAELVAAQHGLGSDGTWLRLGLIAGVYVLAEGIEGYVLIPKVLGDSLGLHPVVILVSVFVGGAALGLFGFLIAIPLAATVIILFRELVMPAIEDFAEEDSHTDDGGTSPGDGAASAS